MPAITASVAAAGPPTPRLPGARRHRGVAVDIDEPFRRREMPDFADVMLVVAERDRIERALGRLAAHQAVEALGAEPLIDRAQPVRALGVVGRSLVIETGRVGEIKRGHAGSWRAKARFSRSR